MALWLKYEAAQHGTYTIPQINTIPTGVQGVAIVAGILSTSLCMVYPIWTTFTAASVVLLFCNVVLLVWDIPVGLHFTAYYLLGLTSCITPILFPWVNMIMKDDAEARAFTTGAMVGLELSFFNPSVFLSSLLCFALPFSWENSGLGLTSVLTIDR